MMQQTSNQNCPNIIIVALRVDRILVMNDFITTNLDLLKCIISWNSRITRRNLSKYDH